MWRMLVPDLPICVLTVTRQKFAPKLMLLSYALQSAWAELAAVKMYVIQYHLTCPFHCCKYVPI